MKKLIPIIVLAVVLGSSAAYSQLRLTPYLTVLLREEHFTANPEELNCLPTAISLI